MNWKLDNQEEYIVVMLYNVKTSVATIKRILHVYKTSLSRMFWGKGGDLVCRFSYRTSITSRMLFKCFHLTCCPSTSTTFRSPNRNNKYYGFIYIFGGYFGQKDESRHSEGVFALQETLNK